MVTTGIRSFTANSTMRISVPFRINGFMVKNYKNNGYFYTNPVHYYPPDANELFDRKGNIAEWTSDESGDLTGNIKVLFAWNHIPTFWYF